MITFCPFCWTELRHPTEACPECGRGLSEWDEASFVKKLIHALSHPEPTTPIRAAGILGRLRATVALPALLELARRQVATGRPDPFITAAVLRAIGEIGDFGMAVHLQPFLRSDLPFLVRRAAQDALNKLGNPAEDEAAT